MRDKSVAIKRPRNMAGFCGGSSEYKRTERPLLGIVRANCFYGLCRQPGCRE